MPRLFVFLVLCAGLSCQIGTHPPVASPSGSTVALSDGWLAMGTFFEVEIRVDASRGDAARSWIREARREIDRLERIYSRYDPESELSRFNRRRASDVRTPLQEELSSELTGILAGAERLRSASGGAFDVRIESRIDLDGLSKGAVLDRLRVDFLDRFPNEAALLSFGQSSIAAIGDPDGGGWRLVLQSSDPARGALGEVRLRDQSLSMSSSRGHLRKVDGQTASHVVDPGSGQPVVGTVEAVVIAESAMEADAWSTALVVIGKLPDGNRIDFPPFFEALLIDAEGDVSRTAGWPRAND